MAKRFPAIYSIGTFLRHTEAGDYSKFYYTTPLYEGKKLSDYISGDSLIPSSLTANIMLQLIFEIKKIHKLGYIHLGISPENIIIDHNVEKKTLNVQLINWNHLVQNGTTIQGKCIGDEAFMDPEMLHAFADAAPFTLQPSTDLSSFRKTCEFMIDHTNFTTADTRLKTEMRLLCYRINKRIETRIDLQEIIAHISVIFGYGIEKMPISKRKHNSLLPKKFDKVIKLKVLPS